MNTLIDRIFKFFQRYKNINKILHQKTTTKSTVKSVLSSMLISTILVLPIILFIVNMFIYAKLTVFLSILMFIVILVWGLLYFVIYYKLLTYYHPEINEVNYKLPMWVETIFVEFFLIIFGLVVLTTIF